jgi:hypothetical protein
MSYQKLYVIDRASFLLDAQLLSSQTSGTFTGSSGSLLGTQSWNMPAGYKAVLTIENEQILLSGMSISGGVITCTIDTRGYNNTTAATHSSGVTCEIHLTKAHVDALQDEVAAFNQGYIFQSPVTTVVSATQHTVSGDLTAIFTAGRVFLFKIGSTWYRSVIRSSSYGGGTTTINITGDGLPGSGTVTAAGFEFFGSINKPVDYLLIKEASTVPADNPPSGYSWIFAKGKGWFMKDSDGKTRQISKVQASASSSGGTLTLDWSLANIYDVTLTENITTVTHSGGVEGQEYTLRFKQHASAPKTVTLGGKTRYSVTIPSFAMTQTVSVYDLINFTYNATDDKYDVIDRIQGIQTSPPAAGSEFIQSGTSGEVIAAGDAVYLKASDGKYWKTDVDADESTYQYRGIALTGASGADQTFTFMGPGGIITGLSGLTINRYYYVSSTAGALSATPHSTRYARIAQANSTTSIRVLEPKFIRQGTASVSGTGSQTQACGFRPARVSVCAGGASNQYGCQSVGHNNMCAGTYREDYSSGVYWGIGFADTGSAWSLRFKPYAAPMQYCNGLVDNYTDTGFDLNCTTYSNATYFGTVTVHWTAEN